MTLKYRLMSSMAILGILPAVIIAVLAWNNGASSLKHATFSHLESIRASKLLTVQHYFKALESEVQLFAESPAVVSGTEQLIQAYHNVGEELAVDTRQLADFKESLTGYYQSNFWVNWPSTRTQG